MRPLPVVEQFLTAVQFEELISSKIEETKDIPEVISETGKIGMPHKGLLCSRYSLFLNKINLPTRDYAEDWTTIPSSHQHQLRWLGS